jgi:ketosteroid isomerase-like protein
MMPEGRPPILRAGPTLTVLRRQTDGTWAIYRDANMLAVVNDPQN